jgi:ankyrin repeat protein
MVRLLKLALVLAMAATVVEFRPLFDWATGRPGPHLRLFNAIGACDTNGMETALTDGASPVALEDSGMLPLTYAACAANERIIRRLVALGADVNAPDSYGLTPLMWAAMQDRADIVEVLLAMGADPTRRDHHNYSAYRIAQARQANEALAVLSQDELGRVRNAANRREP